MLNDAADTCNPDTINGNDADDDTMMIGAAMQLRLASQPNTRLCPNTAGKYCKGGTDTLSAPFRFCEATLYRGNTCWPGPTIPLHAINTTDYGLLNFTNQKNAVKGKSIRHGPLHHQVACLLRALRCRVTYLQAHHAPSNTPLFAYTKNGQ